MTWPAPRSSRHRRGRPGWSTVSARLALRAALMAANALSVAATLARQPRPCRSSLLCLLFGASERNGGDADAALAADFAGEPRALAWPDVPLALGGFDELSSLRDVGVAGGVHLPSAVLPLALAPLPDGCTGGTSAAALVAGRARFAPQPQLPFLLCTLFRNAPAAVRPGSPPAQLGLGQRTSRTGAGKPAQPVGKRHGQQHARRAGLPAQNARGATSCCLRRLQTRTAKRA